MMNKQYNVINENILAFRIMMRKMREHAKDENYYSTDFVRLLRYLSYC